MCSAYCYSSALSASESTSAAQCKRSQNSSLLFSNSFFKSLEAVNFYTKYVSCLYFYLSSCKEHVSTNRFSGAVSVIVSKQRVLSITAIYIILSKTSSLGMEDERSKLCACLWVVFLMLFSPEWCQSPREEFVQDVCYEIDGLSV